eukprot:5374993-Alexandrium_andersonii.AAC.1
MVREQSTELDTPEKQAMPALLDAPLPAAPTTKQPSMQHFGGIAAGPSIESLMSPSQSQCSSPRLADGAPPNFAAV